MRHDSRSEFSLLRERAGISIEDLAPRVGFSVSTIYRWERGDAQPRQAAVFMLQELARSLHPAPNGRSPSFRFIDLFAGIGGLRRGFEPLGGQCVFTSEWDRYANATYKANFACDHEVEGDITKIHADQIPEHDVLLAGFPCQPFSIAGVSKKNALNRPHGFDCETQGTLFFEVERIIAAHRPKAFLLENVKNLVNHDRGRTFDVIFRTLTQKLGYQVHWRVVDAKSFVPQHRERIFIVGFREGNDFSFDDLDLPDPLNGPRLKSVLHPEDGSEPADEPFTNSRGQVNEKYILTDHLWRYLRNYADKHRAKGNGFGFGLVGPNDVTRTLSARYYKDGSEILVDRGRGKNPRRLTPRECARLMGFEKPGETRMVIPVSDTQAYKQFGNAVVVPVVEAVARSMAPWIVAGDEAVGSRHRQIRLPLIG